MGALDDFLAGGKGVQPSDMGFPKAPAKTDQRLEILRQELADEQAKLQAGDTKAQANIDAINREIKFIGGKSYEPKAKPASTGSALNDFLSGGTQPQQVQPQRAAPKPIPQVPATTEAAQPNIPTQVGRTAAGLADTILGGIQTLPGAALAETGYAGVRALEGLGLVEPGRAERGRAAAYKAFVEPFAKPVGETFGVAQTPEYKGEASQQINKFIGENLDKGADWISQKTGMPKADVENIIAQLTIAAPAAVKGAKGVVQAQFEAKKPVVRVEPTIEPKPKVTYEQLQEQLQRKKGKPFEVSEQMAGVGAARAADASMLAEAKARATPELRADLEKIKPGDINVDALNRVMEADQLPVPVRLTRGQATQNPVLISTERNERGLKEQTVARLNEQNKALQENANLMKEQVAPDVNTTSHIEDAENAINRMAEKIKSDDAKITEAYNSLKNYGAGKLEVDSQSFGNNALKALGEFDEQEFLPSSILSRINSYKEGKTMNFNQFENLRTVLARETRKAQAANDGNAVHALTVVRSELEKMPLLNETGEAKALADKARALAKSQFDLLDKKRDTYNPLYADVMNGVSDTKDFIPKLVFRSKNKDFVKTLDTLKDDPQSLQHLRSGALDYMIRESTDASGNFLTGKFNKLVENLDVNKKLDLLFGKDAKTIRAIANTGKVIEARPKGAFVNESGTAVAIAPMVRQYGGELVKRIPGVGAIVEPAQQLVQQRKAAKEMKKTLRPAAGVRLSDIGKK